MFETSYEGARARALAAVSRKAQTVLHNALQSEAKGATEASKDICHKRELCEELKIKQEGPTKLYTESASLIAVVKNAGLHQKNNQFNRDINYINECREAMLVELDFISTNDNTADVLTKAKRPRQHTRLSRRLMGTGSAL